MRPSLTTEPSTLNPPPLRFLFQLELLFPDGTRVVSVRQEGNARFLWFNRDFSTLLQCRTSHPSLLRSTSPSPSSSSSYFEFKQPPPTNLNHRDNTTTKTTHADPTPILEVFHGHWRLTPHFPDGAESSPQNQNQNQNRPVIYTNATLIQDILPAGVPHRAINKIPGLRNLVWNLSTRALRRLVDDLRRIEDRVVQQGEDLRSILRPEGWADRVVEMEGPRGNDLVLSLSDLLPEGTSGEALGNDGEGESNDPSRPRVRVRVRVKATERPPLTRQIVLDQARARARAHVVYLREKGMVGSHCGLDVVGLEDAEEIEVGGREEGGDKRLLS